MAPIYADAQYFCRSFLAIVFATGVLGKIGAWRQFVDTVREISGFAPKSASVAAGGVVALETASGLSTFCGASIALPGAAMALLLFAAFTWMLAALVRERREISCACFGRNEQTVSEYDVYRNVAFIVIDLAYIAALLRGGSAEFEVDATALGLLSGLALLAFVVLTNLKQIAIVR